jgi:hypothetical protein
MIELPKPPIDFAARTQGILTARKIRLREFYQSLPPVELETHPIACQGEKCDGIVWYWQGELELTRKGQRGTGWVPVSCDCDKVVDIWDSPR